MIQMVHHKTWRSTSQQNSSHDDDFPLLCVCVATEELLRFIEKVKQYIKHMLDTLINRRTLLLRLCHIHIVQLSTYTHKYFDEL